MSAMPKLALAAAVCLLPLVGCGSNDGASGRVYELALTVDDSTDEYRYVAVDPVDIQVGDEVTFQMENTGALAHDLQIKNDAGEEIAVAPAVNAGETLSLTATFDEAGYYSLNCLVDDHLTEHNMQVFVEVTEPND